MTNQTTLTLDAVIKKFVSLRDKKAVIKAALDVEVKAIDEKLDKIGAYIKEQADAQGVTSFKTQHGTAFLTTTAFAQVADWDAVLNFVKANGAWDMFERRVSKKAVQAWIENTKEVPPGVNYGTRIDVGVRRPTDKGGSDEVA
jgi:hypothetical protein